MKFGKWRAAIDKHTGRVYYYHNITKEVTWVKPQAMIDQEEKKSRKKGWGIKITANKKESPISPEIIKAFTSPGVYYFLDDNTKNFVESALLEKKFNLVKEAIFNGFLKSDKVGTEPITITLCEQLKKNHEFDMILSIKALGDAISIKESPSPRHKSEDKKKSSFSPETEVQPKSPQKVPSTQSIQSRSPPPTRSPPPINRGLPPSRGSPPPKSPPPSNVSPRPKSIPNSDVLPPVELASPSVEKSVSEKPLVPPTPDQTVEEAGGLLPPPSADILKPPSLPLTPPAVTSSNPKNETKAPSAGLGDRSNLLLEIQKGRKLKRIQTKSRIPAPPPEDASMENALRLRLEDQRQYLEAINSSSSDGDSDWESD